MRDAPELTVVIPTRDRWNILRRTLAALERQSVRGFGVVVVVDGEDQQPPELPGDVEIVRVPQGGPGAARNAGVERVATPLVLFLGDDMIPRPDLVEQHLARHARDGGPTVGVLGSVRWHAEVRRTPLLRWIDRDGMQFDYAGITGDDAGWGRFYSCNVSLPVALLREVGGFDPDFTYYYEDLDLGYRLHRAGLQLRYAPGAVVEHLHEYDEARFAARLTGIARGEWLMGEKHDWFEPWYANRFRGADGQGSSRLARRFGAGDRANHAWRAYFAATYLNAFEAEQEVAELRRYLGDQYDEQQLRGHQHVVHHEEEASPDEATFYRTSRGYLYDLTVFAMSGTKRPYRSILRRLVGPGSRLLDYGCGIGSDGMRMLAAGYPVDFADFDNPSVEYLRWRLQHRGLADGGALPPPRIYDVESANDRAAMSAAGYDVVYCFDVIEHVDDPFAFLAGLEATANLVAVNFLEPAPDDTHLHKLLPIPELLARCRDHGIVHYSKHYGRSHFVVYHARRTDPARRLLGHLRYFRRRRFR